MFSPEFAELFNDVMQSTLNRLAAEPAAQKALAQKAQQLWDAENQPAPAPDNEKSP